MFDRMESAEQVEKGEKPSKNTQRAESDHSSLGRKKKGGGSASPSNPEKGCDGKRKRNHAGHQSDDPTGSKKTCLVHGPRHSSEE